MRFGGLSVSASVVGLPLGFFLVELFATSRRQTDRFHEDVRRSPDLFHRQQLAAEDVFLWRELLANASTEQLAQDGHVEMSMNASPATTFEVIQTEFLLCFSKTLFDRAASEGNAQDLSKRPTVATWYAVGQKVLRFVGQHVASHDKSALFTDEFFRYASFANKFANEFPRPHCHDECP